MSKRVRATKTQKYAVAFNLPHLCLFVGETYTIDSDKLADRVIELGGGIEVMEESLDEVIETDNSEEEADNESTEDDGESQENNMDTEHSNMPDIEIKERPKKPRKKGDKRGNR